MQHTAVLPQAGATLSSRNKQKQTTNNTLNLEWTSTQCHTLRLAGLKANVASQERTSAAGGHK
jgi:hypothetical protein